MRSVQSGLKPLVGNYRMRYRKIQLKTHRKHESRKIKDRTLKNRIREVLNKNYKEINEREIDEKARSTEDKILSLNTAVGETKTNLKSERRQHKRCITDETR